MRGQIRETEIRAHRTLHTISMSMLTPCLPAMLREDAYYGQNTKM